MTNPTEQFRESVESALETARAGFNLARGPEDNATTKAEAIASIQASTLQFFTALIGEDDWTPAKDPFKNSPLADEKRGRNQLRRELRTKIDQLIKDLSNE